MYFDTNEAILFRLLSSFFGKDRVIPQMSISCICGEKISQKLNFCTKSTKCLFTIVNQEDDPCLIVELGVDNKDSFDLLELDKQQALAKLLPESGIQYIALSKSDFKFVTDSANPQNWYLFLKDRFEDNSEELNEIN